MAEEEKEDKKLRELLKSREFRKIYLYEVAKAVEQHPEMYGELLNALKDKDPMARYNAALTLGRIGDPKAIAPLIHTLEDKEPFVRSFALFALGEIGDDQVILAIKKLLESEKDENVRQAASYTLGRLYASKVVKSAESATENLENLREEVDVPEPVLKKINEIVAPLKEDLKKIKEDREQERQTFKDTVESLKSRYETTHEAAEKILTLPDDDVRSLTVYTLLNRRIDDTLGATERHINKMYRTITIIVLILGVATVLAAVLDKIVAIFG